MLEEASALLDQAKSLFEDREKQLEKGEAELKRQIDGFEQEKKLMTTVAVADNDVLNLNIGGTLLATKRSTLTQAEGSGLAARFSGRWEECLDHDDQGRIFLDFDPYCFQQILFYLRSRSHLSSAEVTAALPEVEAGKEHAYRDLVKYLALEEYMGYSGGICSRFVEAGLGVQISAEGRKAKGTLPDERMKTMVTSPLSSHVCYIKCRLHNVVTWAFLGIGADVNFEAQCNTSAAATYGWSIDSQQYITGKALHSQVQWAHGDAVIFKADFASQKLSMISSQVSTPSSMPLDISADSQHKYVFMVILFDTGDEVELLPVTAEDKQLLP